MENEKHNILVVDDEAEMVETLKNFLSRKGYAVESALSGNEALHSVEAKKPELILLDLRMPQGLSGQELARMVKKKYPQTKIIVVTGYANEGYVLSKENILEGLLLKPLNLGELEHKLLNVFKESEGLVGSVKQGIRARVLLLKAKLLFVEPSLEIYELLSQHFKALSNRGENYQLEVAVDQETFKEKLLSFRPDIFLFNLTLLKDLKQSTFSDILAKNIYPREVIIYKITDIRALQKMELEKLTKSVEIACLRNGFIEVKWIEI